MNRARSTAFLAAAAVALGLGVTSTASAVDPEYPTGTFSISPTAGYVRGIINLYAPGGYGYVRVTVKTLSLSPGAYVDTIDPGDSTSEGGGEGLHVGDSHIGAEHRFTLGLGTYTPRVYVTDAEDRTTIVTLPSVTFTQDPTPPVVDLDLPAAGARNRVSAWHTLSGHAVDPETEIYDVRVSVLQRREGIWWVWGSLNQRWRKGTKSEAWTLAHVKPAQLKARPVGTDRWLQPKVKGLTKGALAVRVTARSRGVDETAIIQRAYLSRP